MLLHIGAFKGLRKNKHAGLLTRARWSDDAAARHKLDASTGAGAPSNRGGVSKPGDKLREESVVISLVRLFPLSHRRAAAAL